MEVFIKVMNGLAMTFEEDKRFYVFDCSLMSAIFAGAKIECKISIKSSFVE